MSTKVSLSTSLSRRAALRPKPTDEYGNAAYNYYQTSHRRDVDNALAALWQCFPQYTSRVDRENPPPLPLIFIFDEARSLCDYDSLTGEQIIEQKHFDVYMPKEPISIQKEKMPYLDFSNFRALRRALRYLSGNTGPTTPATRVFAVFTDTTSRITNFQPTSWNNPSARVPNLPDAGRYQFPPIYVFSSVDVYSRVLNSPVCISNAEEAANPARLLKFGRAGWYSLYFQGRITVETGPRILDLAEIKLLCITSLVDVKKLFVPTTSPLEQTTLIKLLAVIAPRLALTIGPCTEEASELIASHLAVLTRTDKERHFLQTVYPSEPVLAEASARLTRTYGWAHPLKALLHYIRGGIVEAGFRGELATKIVCLIAMDAALQSTTLSGERYEWQFSRPIPVSRFLDNLIVPLEGYSKFSEYLKGVEDKNDIKPDTINVDNEKLQKFLHGNVFFNHFVRVDVKLSYAMLAQAWNRGAAIMCMTNTKGIDYAIPVMLDTKGEAVFGPLHGPWEVQHVEEARKHMSYILINSRNYASGKDQVDAAWATKFSARNLREYGVAINNLNPQSNAEDDDSGTDDDQAISKSHRIYAHNDKPNDDIKANEEKGDVMAGADKLEMQNVFMSLVQDFGTKLRREPWVRVGEILQTPTRPRAAQPPLKRPPLSTQFIVVAKGIEADTYQCLKNPRANASPESDEIRGRTRNYLKELLRTKMDYVDPEDKSLLVAGMQNIPLVYGDSMMGSENWDNMRPSLESAWRAAQADSAIQTQQASRAVSESGELAEIMEEVVMSPPGA
jgi:hypothetical protein